MPRSTAPPAQPGPAAAAPSTAPWPPAPLPASRSELHEAATEAVLVLLAAGGVRPAELVPLAAHLRWLLGEVLAAAHALDHCGRPEPTVPADTEGGGYV